MRSTPGAAGNSWRVPGAYEMAQSCKRRYETGAPLLVGAREALARWREFAQGTCDIRISSWACEEAQKRLAAACPRARQTSQDRRRTAAASSLSEIEREALRLAAWTPLSRAEVAALAGRSRPALEYGCPALGGVNPKWPRRDGLIRPQVLLRCQAAWPFELCEEVNDAARPARESDDGRSCRSRQ